MGKAIERRGGRNVLAFSAAALGLGQLGLSAAPSLGLYIGAWLIMGLGMAAGLYDAAFATLGRLYGLNARSAITTLTLFGGFASTLCWPLSAFLVSSLGWRGACLAYAAIELGFSLPLYLWAIPRFAPPAAQRASEGPAGGLPPAARPSLSVVILLAAALTLAAVLSSTLSVHLLTVLQAGGLALATAVGLGALVGPCQVAARTIEMAIAKHHHPIWTLLAAVTFVAIGISALWARLPVIPAALAFYGSGNRASIHRAGHAAARHVRSDRIRDPDGAPRDAEPHGASRRALDRRAVARTGGSKGVARRSRRRRLAQRLSRSAFIDPCAAQGRHSALPKLDPDIRAAPLAVGSSLRVAIAPLVVETAGANSPPDC